MHSPGEPLPPEEYASVYSRVPRLTVEVVLRRRPDGATYLTRRADGPCRGKWHVPGGTVRFGEPLERAVERVAERELSVRVLGMVMRGYVEYPSHYLNGLDSPVGIVFEAVAYAGEPTPNGEASEGGWFSRLPEDMHPDQDEFLIRHGLIGA